MGPFGFELLDSKRIDYDKSDGRLLNEILEKEPSFKRCISCGGCTATCTAGSLTNFNIRKINLMLRHGQTEGLEEEISKCMLCGKCFLVCPRDINLRNVIMLIKKGVLKYNTEKKKI